MPVSVMRQVGGSVMVAVPPEVLKATGTGPRVAVTWSVDGRRASFEAKEVRPRYKLSELLAQCDPNAPQPEYDRAWLETASLGKEAI
jgi:antitoxin ChpS